MKTINLYITEKLHLNKDYKAINPVEELKNFMKEFLDSFEGGKYDDIKYEVGEVVGKDAYELRIHVGSSSNIEISVKDKFMSQLQREFKDVLNLYKPVVPEIYMYETIFTFIKEK